MHNSQNSTVSKYLPFDEFHIAELTGISPDHIRGSARRLAKDREQIKYNTSLNFICKELGFRGGFSGFKKSYETDLEPFMLENGLHQFGLSTAVTCDRPIRINRQQISDRIFRSGRHLPSRVFVGDGVEWWDCLKAALEMPGFAVSDWSGRLKLQSNAEIDNAMRIPPANWRIRHEGQTLSLDQCCQLRNLLGDQLLTFSEVSNQMPCDFVPMTYFPDTMTPDEVGSFNADLLGAADILSKVISQMENGWVDVVPFNEKLVFLRDGDGQYDFVFLRFRSSAFEHSIHQPFLKNADVPKSDDHYHFQRWLYFEYDGWMEKDRHEAEVAFYANGGQIRNYPYADEILRIKLMASGRYVPPMATAKLIDGYRQVTVGNKVLAVSDPISIGRFRQFMTDENELYAAYRPSAPEQDDWQQSNHESDPSSAPASVTWYDASAFAATVSKKHSLPVRLPTEEEWLGICAEFRSSDQMEKVYLRCSASEKVVKRGPAKADSGWCGTRFACSEVDLPWEATGDGIRVLRAIDVGEWLLPAGAVINTLHHGAMSVAAVHLASGDCRLGIEDPKATPNWADRISASRGRMLASSTGAYKAMRFGFRLVYEIEQDASLSQPQAGEPSGAGDQIQEKSQ